MTINETEAFALQIARSIYWSIDSDYYVKNLYPIILNCFKTSKFMNNKSILSLDDLSSFPSGVYIDGDLHAHDCYVIMQSPQQRFFYCVRKHDKKLLHVHEAHLKIEEKK